jgi:predicted DNA-binding protein (MmcQ/YjbR family)
MLKQREISMALTFDSLRKHCLSREGGVTEDFPFDQSTLVFRVNGGIFLLLDIDKHPMQFNVKCDPDLAIELREKYEAVLPGYHMNKKHWNTVVVDGNIPVKEVLAMIDHSHALVASKKKKQDKRGK